MRPIARGLAALLVLWANAGAQGAPPPYRDARLPTEARVRDLLARMTLEEKFWQLYMSPGDRDDPANDWSHGAFGLQIGVAPPAGPGNPPPARAEVARAHAARVNAIQRFFVDSTRLGIPIIPFDEAVHGLMRDGATVFPAAIALAATWDTAVAGRVFAAAAHEAASRGVRQVLSPVVNIATDVRWGRVEETYGEDPFLSSVFAAKFTDVFERLGVIATPKHFVANVGEGGRDSYPIDLDRRALEETHFPPFRAAIATGAQSVMTAYNSVDGRPATQNRWLLTDVLRRQWGFEGFVISDAAATGGATVLHYTEPNTPTAAKHAWEAGLDVVFQSSWREARPYLQAVTQGLVAPEVIDSAVAHVLRAKFALGLFDHPYVDAGAAAVLAGAAEHLAVARDAEEKAIVLLRNERHVLPFGASVKRVAVIGEDVAEARLGGYSAAGSSPVSVLAALRERLGASGVRYAPGPGRLSPEYVPVRDSSLSTDSAGVRVVGLRGEYFDNPDLAGAPRFTRRDRAVNFGWTLNSPGRGLAFDWYGVRWTGTIRVPAGGVRRIGVEGNDGWRLWLDGRLVIDHWAKASYGAHLANVALAGGTSHEMMLEFHETTGNARVKLVWDAGVRHDWRAAIDSAVRVARASDVAVVVAGVEEGEFRDRSTLALPGHQEELIEAVAATGKPTVVVLVGGSAVTGGQWIDRVGAVLEAWYPGEQGGPAVARVLFGDVNPAGRLPVTFAMRDGQLPLVYNHKPTGRGDDYVDGTGMPLFPFGHGLSYTTFAYSG
ncbi:MAG TPA: glycoside hydrolase family 3 N-terminal domain-containing protein, partial [Gemmatimonadaceae bacterium]|nr:glycoside hydrolase family 3 N-terminal domain-containing protein [Gemmatimonadaceae bacterium]